MFQKGKIQSEMDTIHESGIQDINSLRLICSIQIIQLREKRLPKISTIIQISLLLSILDLKSVA